MAELVYGALYKLRDIAKRIDDYGIVEIVENDDDQKTISDAVALIERLIAEKETARG